MNPKPGDLCELQWHHAGREIAVSIELVVVASFSESEDKIELIMSTGQLDNFNWGAFQKPGEITDRGFMSSLRLVILERNHDA